VPPPPPPPVALIVTWPVEPEIVTLSPATIEVTIPVRLVPEPLNEVAVTTPEILAPEEVTMPLKFPDVAVKIPTEIPLVVLFPLPVTEFKVSVSVYEVRYVFVSILPSALRNCDEVPPDLTKDVAVTIPTVILGVPVNP